MAKPKITRIKAGESAAPKVDDEQTPITRKKVVVKDKKQDESIYTIPSIRSIL